MENKRSEEILEYVVKGYSTREIAEIFNISQHSVKSYIHSLERKFMVRNRVYLAYIIGRQEAYQYNIFM